MTLYIINKNENLKSCHLQEKWTELKRNKLCSERQICFFSYLECRSKKINDMNVKGGLFEGTAGRRRAKRMLI
jgi:hypothetical protein